MMAGQSYDNMRDPASCRWGRNAVPYGNTSAMMQAPRESAAARMTALRPVGQLNQEELLEWIGLTKFALIDANLYLDTHPDDTEAIRYFQEHNRLYLEAMNEYARVYGPLTISHAQHCGTWWEWVDQPWPWQ